MISKNQKKEHIKYIVMGILATIIIATPNFGGSIFDAFTNPKYENESFSYKIGRTTPPLLIVGLLIYLGASEMKSTINDWRKLKYEKRKKYKKQTK